MEFRSRSFSSCRVLLFVFSLQVLFLLSAARPEISDNPKIQRVAHGYRHLQGCQDCGDEKDTGVTTTYTDASGTVQTYTIKLKGKSGSTQQVLTRLDDYHGHSTNEDKTISPVKLERQILRQKRKKQRTAALLEPRKDIEYQMEKEAITRSRNLDNKFRSKYSVWRREFENQKPDSTLKLMRDQIIMAKVYASIAHSKNHKDLYDSLVKRIEESRHAIGEASSDVELQPGALELAKAMGHVLSVAKDKLYDCAVVARKLRAMLQYQEENVDAVKKQGTFLSQLAAKTLPKPLHCLPLRLTTDYFLRDQSSEGLVDTDKLEDNTLYHYAIFSDNVLATSVVVNSTTIHVKEPEKHVFHIVTDRFNFVAMKMWFLVNPPHGSTIHVESIDKFKWLNSSYCSVLRQLESARLKEYYFKSNHPLSLSVGEDNLKYRNPKYLSMLNHLRFYMPEVYPKLDKILFLDDDVVVQKDLTPLWSVDMKGMVNGAVETCKESFHRYDTYLNFSNPKISQNFNPRACGWAFGMNLFDLKEWKRQNITRIYHYWQDLNVERTLWKLGSLPPGLITFYNLTHPLDRNWHVLGLGYVSGVDAKEIEGAAVIHYNGNFKPWLDLAMSQYRKYWTKYVRSDNPYLRDCHIMQ